MGDVQSLYLNIIGIYLAIQKEKMSVFLTTFTKSSKQTSRALLIISNASIEGVARHLSISLI